MIIGSPLKDLRNPSLTFIIQLSYIINVTICCEQLFSSFHLHIAHNMFAFLKYFKIPFITLKCATHEQLENLATLFTPYNILGLIGITTNIKFPTPLFYGM
jgi:hypothetical protein